MKKNTFIILGLLLFASTLFSQTQLGDVVRYSKISNQNGNFGSPLSSNDQFGVSVTVIGDINGDGVNDIAVGAPKETSLSGYGVLYVLLMDTSGNVQSYKKLSQNLNGISNLDPGGQFGMSVECIGDVNNDGINDIAVGEHERSYGSSAFHGAIHIICLDSTGTAISQNIISNTSGYGTGGLPIQGDSKFGREIAMLGDINNDGYPDLAVSSFWESNGSSNYRKGSVWILFLDQNQNVASYNKIYDGVSNFNSNQTNYSYLGSAVENIGDFNGDGKTDIAVGCLYDNDGGSYTGSVYFISLDTNGSVLSYFKLSDNTSGLNVQSGCNFGASICKIGDIYGDGQYDIAVGAPRYGVENGAVYILNFDTAKNFTSYDVIYHNDLGNTSGNRIGSALAYYNDYNSDSYPELLIGEFKYQSERGAMNIVSIKTPFEVNITTTDINCHGDSTGTAIVEIFGNNGPYTITSSVGSGDTIENIPAGNYQLTVTDINGKFKNINFTINEPPPLNLSLNVSNDSICLGHSTNLNAIATGGTGSITYHWNNSLSNSYSHTVAPSQSTNYTVYVKDTNNCISSVESATVEVNQVTGVSSSGLNVAYCGNDAAVSLSGSPAGGIFSGPGATSTGFDPSLANIGINQIVYTYSDAYGCQGTDTQTTNVIAPPNIQFNLANAYCANESDINLQGLISPVGGTIKVNNTTTNTFSPQSLGTGQQKVSYTVSDANGCTSTDSVITNINIAPTASISGLSTDYCEDDADVIFSYSPAGGQIYGTGVTNNTFSPTTAGVGNHTISYAVSNIYNCADTATHNISVNALTPLTLFMTDSLFCNSEGAQNISISPIGGTLSGPGVNNSNHSFNPSTANLGQNTITYNYTNTDGCSSTSDITVIVNTPTNLTLTGLDTIYCLYDSPAQITVFPQGGDLYGNGIYNNTFTPSAAGVGNHQVYYAYDNGCKDTIFHNLQILSAPSVSISGLNSDYCENSAVVNLNLSPQGGQLIGNGIQSNTFVPSLAGAGNHSIIYTATNANQCSNSDTVNLTVHALPQTTIYGDTVVCMGDSVNLSVNGNSNYLWDFGISGNNFFVYGVNSRYIRVITTDSNNCQTMDSVYLKVNSLPQIDLGNDTSIYGNDSLELSLSGNYINYLWNTGAITPSITVYANSLAPGQYKYWLEVENQNNCVNSDSIQISITTGIDDLELFSEINLYPNPSDGEINIELPENHKITNAVITDSQGKLIDKIDFETNELKYKLDLSTYTKGIYFIKFVDSDNYSKTLKLIVN
jgi:hypothetical protein